MNSCPTGVELGEHIFEDALFGVTVLNFALYLFNFVFDFGQLDGEQTSGSFPYQSDS